MLSKMTTTLITQFKPAGNQNKQKYLFSTVLKFEVNKTPYTDFISFPKTSLNISLHLSGITTSFYGVVRLIIL